MINVYTDIWLRLSQLGAKYQSGAQVVATFNGALAEVQNELFSLLSPYYATNEKVRAILAVWVKSINASATSGTYTIPSTPVFDRVVSLSVTDTATPPNILYEINPITESELGLSQRIPQRKPDLAKKKVYYLMNGATEINFFPKPTALPFLLYYLTFPTEAKIAFTYTVVSGEDVMAYNSAGSTDLAWTKDAANVILYKMLEKYGVTVRDKLMQEYARLGISETLNMGGKA